MYDFAKFKTIQSFGNATRNDIITMDMAIDEQEQLAKKIREFNINIRPKNLNMKKKRVFKRNGL